MVEMELLRWLADSLSLPFVEEAPDGAVRANAVAREMFPSAAWPSLPAAVRQLAECSDKKAELAKLEKLAGRARAGERVHLRASEQRQVLLFPCGASLACALVVSQTPGPLSDRQPTRAEHDRLAAGTSHEMANALGAIVGWAALARQGTRVEEALELIETAAKTAWSIARSALRGTQGSRESAPPLTDLSAFADEAVRLLAPKAAEAGVTVKRRIESGLKVAGTRDDVWSAIWNPMTNAVEAMAHGGTLRIAASAQDDWVRFVVQDDGPGMDEKIRDRVFDPYFTTKRTGTGLGLALVKQAVDHMGGKIDLQSNRGSGTRFQIDLPRATGDQSHAQVKSNASDEAGSVTPASPLTGRVLIVDDDRGLRDMMATALEMRGMEVVAVATPREALSAEGSFDLALIDMVLPEQAGDALLAELRSADKVQAGLMVTGREMPTNLRPDGAPDGVLRKPFQLDELFQRVGQILDGQPATDRHRNSIWPHRAPPL